MTLMSDYTSLQSQYTSLLQQHNSLLSSNQQKIQTLQTEHQHELDQGKAKISELEKQLRRAEETRSRDLHQTNGESQAQLQALQTQVKDLELQLETERNEKKKLRLEMQLQSDDSSQLKDLQNQVELPASLHDLGSLDDRLLSSLIISRWSL
jgi:DNA repair exonuclease SbcCD ATPase subunit